MANSRISVEHAHRHMDAHRAFCRKIEDFKNQVDSIGPQNIVDFLVHWFTEHIQQSDQELARLLNA